MVSWCGIGCSARSTLQVTILTILFLDLRCENNTDTEPDDVICGIELLNLTKYEHIMNQEDMEDAEAALCIFIAEEAEQIFEERKKLRKAASALPQKRTLNEKATRFARATSRSNLAAGLIFLRMDCNFVIVLWTKGAKKPWYHIAAANTALVGRQIAFLLWKLTKDFPETVLSSEVHLIGFSLGAHVAGFCGRTFTLITNKTIGRITGLDPANALFTYSGVHLRPSDADFVDVIHTNRGKASRGKMGIDKKCGHVDFYPNGGSRQPGCSWFSIGCSHRRSAEYFVESLTDEPCKFVSYSCTNGLQDSVGACNKNQSDESEMGYNSKDALGRDAQMLPTNGNPPYCKEW
uniref:Putative phospholipase n=1 Tax=Ixodes ricinus TaxID=34613 RepID=A0A147BEJ0_IXORI